MEILTLLWLPSILACIAIGARKGQAVGGAILGIVAGPLGVIIALAVDGGNKKCPQCAEQVKKEANVCKHCGAQF